MAKKSKLLKTIGEKFSVMKIDVENIPIDTLVEISNEMKGLTDYRNNYSYKPLENSVMITLIGLLADCDEWEDIYDFSVLHYEWFKKILNLEYDLPSVSTLRRNMAMIDSNELEEICVKYIIKKIEKYEEIFNIKEAKTKDIISYDGKTCNGSKRINTKNGKIKPTNAMSAFNVDKDICLATKFIDEKTNEIPTGPELIKLLDLTNTISVFDALNTQEDTIKAIVDKGGNYVAAVKNNQKSLFRDIKDYFKDKKLYEQAAKESYYSETEKAHNDIEKRTYIMTSNIEWLNNKEKWKNIKSIGLVTREYILDGRRTTDTRYFITDLLSNEIRDFAKAVREEWGIENNLHWHLDYTFKEDYSKTYIKNAQANLNILRKLALNILKLVQPLYNVSLKRIRKRLIMDFENEINNIFTHLSIDTLQQFLY